MQLSNKEFVVISLLAVKSPILLIGRQDMSSRESRVIGTFLKSVRRAFLKSVRHEDGQKDGRTDGQTGHKKAFLAKKL